MINIFATQFWSLIAFVGEIAILNTVVSQKSTHGLSILQVQQRGWGGGEPLFRVFLHNNVQWSYQWLQSQGLMV